MSGALSAADIYVSLILADFWITFVEALYAGYHVTTNLGGPREIVDDSCGILVPPIDKQALAETLRRLIDDSTLRKQLGVAGPTRAKALCDPAAQMDRFYQAVKPVASVQAES